MTPKTKTILEFTIVTAFHVLLATPFICLAYSGAMISSGEWPLPEKATLPFIYGSLVVVIACTLYMILRMMLFSAKYHKEMRHLEEKIAKLEGEQE